MNPAVKVQRLLESVGAFLVRKRKHEIWRLPNGKNHVVACTSSDKRSGHNSFSDLKHQLGICTAVRTESPAVKVKKSYTKRHAGNGKRIAYTPIDQPFANALRLSGAVETGLRHQIDSLQHEMAALKNTVSQLRESNQRYRDIIGGGMISLLRERVRMQKIKCQAGGVQ